MRLVHGVTLGRVFDADLGLSALSPAHVINGRSVHRRSGFVPVGLFIEVRRETMKYLVIGLLLLVGACKSLPYPVAGADPADPSAPVAPVRYQSALGPYVSQRPVGPSDWREQNRRVTPPAQQ